MASVAPDRAAERPIPRPVSACAATALLALCVAPAGAADEAAEPAAGRARAWLDALLSDDPERAGPAYNAILDAGDRRFVAPFLELLRMDLSVGEIGFGAAAHAGALEELSGRSLGADWPAWVEWYGSAGLSPPPGFTGWKGRLLARIDPRFASLLTENAESRIRVEEIVWGGVRVEGIPALDHPEHVTAAQATYLTDEEPVFGIALGGEACAYPLRILDWHEMANDVVGGVPLTLAYCTLCGSGLAYDARREEGEPFRFATSGLLYRSNKLMFDRQTRTLWNQLTGRAVLGPLAASERKLSRIPVVLARWKDWRERHPATRVLSLETGYARDYSLGAAYGDYFASGETMFPVWQRRDLLPRKARVYGIDADGAAKAWPLARLVDERVVNDRVGERALVLVASAPGILVEGRSARTGRPVRYEAGAEVRAFARGAHRFAAAPEPGRVRDERGRTWRVAEDALLGPGGERAERVEGVLAYWFAWNAFFPHSEVYGESGAAQASGSADRQEERTEPGEGRADGAR